MRVTYDVLLGLLESHPRIQYAMHASGLSPGQVAAFTYQQITDAPEGRARDAVIARCMADLGLQISGAADFDRASEAIAEHLRGEHTRDERIDALVGGSFDRARAKHVHRVLAEGSLSQGLNDRMRERDRHVDRMNGSDRPVELPAHMAHHREDNRDLRSAVHAAIAGAHGGRRGLQIEHDPGRSVRDTLRDAFDAASDREAERDPLESMELRRSSNVV